MENIFTEGAKTKTLQTKKLRIKKLKTDRRSLTYSLTSPSNSDHFILRAIGTQTKENRRRHRSTKIDCSHVKAQQASIDRTRLGIELYCLSRFESVTEVSGWVRTFRPKGEIL